MKIIGLTGGFATGKSTVCRMFEKRGLPQINADTIAHQWMSNTRTSQKIIAKFGREILNKKNQIDRKKLGDIVFHHPKKRKTLEKIIHPLVRNTIHQKIETFRKKETPIILLEIPLLFEVHWHKEEPLDAIIVVWTDQKTQIDRARKKFGLSLKEVKARLKAQLPLAKKMQHADYLVNNSQSLKNTRKQVEAIYKKLTA